MTSHDDQSRERRVRRSWEPIPSDLSVLVAHPSLARFRHQGRLLDRLPTTALAWAFVGALATSYAAYGTDGAAVVLAWTALALLLTVVNLATGDTGRARAALTVARFGLLGAIAAVGILAAAVGAPAFHDAHAGAPAPKPSATTPAAPAAYRGINLAP